MDIADNTVKPNENRGKTACYAVFAVSLLLFVITSAFHEPWLDEAQGWMIARDASYHDMLFYLPHYEGHPPFWWLLLSFPAKLGVPYEAALTGVMLVTYCLSVYLIIFRSPFPTPLKLILPFSYYVFFEYGVVARPYGLLTLGLLLMACSYNERNEKPFRYILSCLLTCSMSAYGIALCGGLSILWCVQILMEYKKNILRFIGTRRFFALLLLLAFAVAEILMVMPYPDTFTIDNEPMTAGRLANALYYLFFMLPGDSLLIGAGMGLGTLLKYNAFPMYDRMVLTIVSLVIWYPLLVLCKKTRKLPELAAVYPFFAFFCTFVYFMPHHEGVFAAYTIFLVWICTEKLPEKEQQSSANDILKKLTEAKTLLLVVCAVFAVNSVWSISAVITDIAKNYYYGREMADYIKENGLDHLNIMSSWYDQHDENDPDGSIVSTSKQHMAVSIIPYFDKNIFFNFNGGNEGYIVHTMDETVNQMDIKEWSSTVPDVIVGEVNLTKVYSDVKNSDYILIKTFEYNKIFKLGSHSQFNSIYLRCDLFDEFPEIQPQNAADVERIKHKQ